MNAKPTLQIDDARVIVTRWDFAPGASTGHHVHAHDYVVVPLTSGTLRLAEPGGARGLRDVVEIDPPERGPRAGHLDRGAEAAVDVVDRREVRQFGEPVEVDDAHGEPCVGASELTAREHPDIRVRVAGQQHRQQRAADQPGRTDQQRLAGARGDGACARIT